MRTRNAENNAANVEGAPVTQVNVVLWLYALLVASVTLTSLGKYLYLNDFQDRPLIAKYTLFSHFLATHCVPI